MIHFRRRQGGGRFVHNDDFGIITLESDFGEEASRLTSPEVRINWLEENYEKVLEVVKDKLEKGDIFGWADLFP